MRSLTLQVAVLLFVVTGASAQLLTSHASTVKMADSGSAVGLHPMGRPVVSVNGSVLTDIDLTREMYTIFPYARQHNGVPKAMEADIRAGALKMIIFEELVYQEARQRKMTIPAAQLDHAVGQFRKQFSSVNDYQQFLQLEFHGSHQALRAKIERSLLIDKLLKIEVTNKSTVSLVEEKAYYNAHPDRFRVPESFAFQSISIIPPPNATATQLNEARKRVQDALRQAKATKSYQEFGLLAEKMSDDDFRVMMGDHKVADRSKLPVPVVNALAAMKPGDVSNVVEFDTNAFTILRLNSHVPAGIRSFDSIKNSLRDMMQRDKVEQLRSALAARLSKNAKIEKL